MLQSSFGVVGRGPLIDAPGIHFFGCYVSLRLLVLSYELMKMRTSVLAEEGGKNSESEYCVVRNLFWY